MSRLDRRWNPGALAAGLLAILAGAGCGERLAPPESSREAPATVGPARTIAVGPPASEAAAACTVGSVAVTDLSAPPSTTAAQLEEALNSVISRRFGPPAGSRGGQLRIELALRSGSEEELHYFGVRALFRQGLRGQSLTAETAENGEVQTVEVCSGDCGEEACRQALFRERLLPAASVAITRLHRLCLAQIADDQALVALLDDEDGEVRAAAAVTAGDRKLVAAREPLLRRLALSDEELPVLLPVIGALGRLGDDSVAAALVRRAQAADERLIRAVAVALADLPGPTSRRYLDEWRRNHPLAEVREVVGGMMNGEL